MRKVSFVILALSTVLGACKPAENPQPAVINNIPVCNGPTYAYNQPNCVTYNQAVYPIVGCPPEYLNLASTAAGVPGNYCLHSKAYQFVFGAASFYGPLQNSGNLGVPQMCDSYTFNSCGTNTGLQCIAYSGRYGICR